ncbi:ExeM/NucH family extracellular endonuclease [Microbacterium sp. 4R-513]|uniref:ExeM/NucH family extracellular endonuclease n=1 Tax=Microbacterium sp. 4R-513 TaxID=2567934 RepID=UPI0013E2051C|nr:ExeM/NucH family extracellular endonuclease [Microbacterium sp. 4R-513]QIG39017.1 ExeM/NucH family extracellular endonuclease [Microbacterium sp. 4R-513]
MHRSVRPLTFVVAGALAFGALAAAPPASAAAPVVINEFSASTAGTDVEYVELLTAPGTDLSGYRVLEIEGDAPTFGVVDGVFAPGAPDASGRVLLSLPANELENGTLSLLLVTGTIPAANADIDANDDGVIDAAGLTVVDAVAVNDGGASDRTYGGVTLGVAYDGQAFAPGGASRIPDGTDTDAPADWVRNDFDLAGIPGFSGTPVFGEAVNTPGALNATVPKPETPVGQADCTATSATIGSVQGSGTASPVSGSVVRIQGTVIADFQTTDLDGFYLQDAGDGDPATSDGIFVFQQDADNNPGNGDGIIDVHVGDVVNVAGSVSEFQSLTEVSAADTEVCATGAALPQPTTLALPLSDPAREAVEGMYVTFAQPLTIAEYFEFGRFNTVTVSLGRQFQPTATVEPGPDAQAALAENIAEQIIIDDARARQNPDPLLHPDGQPFTLNHLFRGGDVLTGVTGVLDQRVRTGDSPQVSSYGIQPTQPAGYRVENPRPAVPEVGGDLKVSSFNVLNYFTTLDDPTTDEDDDIARGANSPLEFERQQAKIVAALAAIDADVFGLMEIENNAGSQTAALPALTRALNAYLGADVYSYVDTGEPIGTDVIATAFMYKKATVEPVGDPAWEIKDPRWAANRNRPPLTQTFQPVAGGQPITISVNHLKSKGSGCGAADPDTGDGQGNCALTRENAAKALVDWLASDPTGQGTGDRTLIIGDLNSYDKENSIDAIRAAGYTDLLFRFQGEYAYSYVFDGQLGYLDHALAGPGLVGDVTGASTWSINADEPQVLDYNTEFKPASQVTGLFAPDPYRSSDHDPVLVGIDVDTTPPTLTVTPSVERIMPPDNKQREVTIQVAVEDESDVTVELVSAEASGSKKAAVTTLDDTTFRVVAANKAVYTFTYKATDAAGNTTTATATVVVGPVTQP